MESLVSPTLANTAAAALSRTPTELFIDGTWRSSMDGSSFDVENPATGDTIASVASATANDARAALDAAVDAQADWARTSTRERAEILRRAFDLVTSCKEELAALISLEMGKPYSESMGEVAYGAEFLRWFSEEAPRSYGRYADTPEGSLRMLVANRPVGPCLLITPWNFPLAMATRKVAPAIAAGCTMVLKPADLTPLTALYFAELLNEAGIPRGVLNVVPTTSASEISEALLSDVRLRKLSFTGSTRVGQHLLRLAADNVLRTSMELGGNAPFIVFEDADLERAVEGALSAKLRNMGEACTAANRFIVHRSVAHEFAADLSTRFADLTIGNGLASGTQIGPVITGQARDNLTDLIDVAINEGAKLVSGGHSLDGAGYFVEPTLLTDVAPTSRIVSDEIFGPVAPLLTFSTEAEAVALAGATRYGLASYVFTRDITRGLRIAELLEFGLIGLNAGVISNAAAPFGGMKQSGLGREGGAEGLSEYQSTQYIGLDPER